MFFNKNACNFLNIFQYENSQLRFLGQNCRAKILKILAGAPLFRNTSTHAI